MTKTGMAALVLLFGTATGVVRAQSPVAPNDSDPASAPQMVASPLSAYWNGGHGPGCQRHDMSCCDKLCAFFTYRRKCCPCKCWGHCCNGCWTRPYLYFLHPCYSGIGGPYPPCCANGGCKKSCGNCGGCGGCGGGGIVGLTDWASSGH
jgi:hypothetical protein